MTRFTQIDLQALPAPEVVETIDVSAIFTRKRDALLALVPSLAEVLALESEPLVMYLQRDAYDEALLRARINDGARSVMPAFATGANLEHLAAFFGVARLVLVPADPAATPPAAAVLESDSDLRARMQLALEAQTTAGTVGSYLYFARTADAGVKDAAVSQPTAGTVQVTILARGGDGAADAGLLETVLAALNADEVRPLCDTVSCVSATIVPFAIEATLSFYSGPDRAVVLAAAQSALTAYLEDRRLIGHDVTRSGIFAALHRPGVQNVDLTQPASDVVIDDVSAAQCTGIVLTDGGVNV